MNPLLSARTPLAALLALSACASGELPADTGDPGSTGPAPASTGDPPLPTTTADASSSDTTATTTTSDPPPTSSSSAATTTPDTTTGDDPSSSTSGTTTAGDDLFPVDYDTSKISVAEQLPVTVDGAPYTVTLYRNDAYRCGRAGNYTFAVVEPDATKGQPAPLWVYLRGGGAGYYDAGGTYVGDETLNDEWSLNVHALALLQVAFSGTPANATTKDTVAGRRVADGHRLVSPSFCDHDLYLGPGHPYPNNPHWDGTDTVDGLLATMAAIDYTAHTHPATHVFVHGTSAGSPGAYGVAHAFSRAGVDLTGVVLDSFVLSNDLLPLFDAGCTELQQVYPGFSLAEATVKHGPFAADPALFLTGALPDPYAVPSFALVGGQDTFCCGPDPALPGAVSDGFTNNCEWSYRNVFAALDAVGSPRFDRLYLAGEGHVLTKDPNPAVHDPLEAWYDAVLAADPAPPWP